MTPTNSRISLTDVASFHEAMHASCAAGNLHVLLVVSRRDIEERNVGRTVDRLMLLTDNLSIARRCRGRLALEIEGYEFDPRALHEIPDAVRHFQSVARHWNYWLAFMDTASDMFPVLVRMLSVGHRLRSDDEVEIVPGDAFRGECICRTFQHLLQGLVALSAQLELPHEESESRIRDVAEAINHLLSD